MRILILGGNGYLGWPSAMQFAAQGHMVTAVDNGLRGRLCNETDSMPLFPIPSLKDRADIYAATTGHTIDAVEGDCCDYDFLQNLVADTLPECIIHYAEQPSAPYSMIGQPEAQLTLENNLNSTMNVIWAVLKHAPECHIIKLGTMGEYGTPNIDIEEGWLDVEHKGRSQRFLYPRQASSLYHTTKVLDTDLLWFYVRTYGLQVTDLMQGPVYGLMTPEAKTDNRLLPHFNYDDIFGTVVNRFLAQAAAGIPLTVYGKGGQTRGYIDLRDCLECVRLAMQTPPGRGQLQIFNQFTETFTVLEIAERIRTAGASLGVNVQVKSIPNPRKEAEDHYYNPAHSGLLELGLSPHYMTPESLAEMLQIVLENSNSIDTKKCMPRIKWK